MSKSSTAAVFTLAVVLSLSGCGSVEPVGALKIAGSTLEGEPILSDEDFEDRAPDMNELPDESSRGILQWRVR